MIDEGSSSSPLIVLRSIYQSFGPSPGTEVLKNIDLTVADGEFVAIVGPSGSGKSTLLNILGVLETPSKGLYLLDGMNVGELKERQRDKLRSTYLGFVFQSSHVIGHETASRNAAFSLMIKGLPRKERVREVNSLLAKFGLMHRANTPAKNLSGGERQRLALARAVGTRPRLLLADEPTGNLDTDNSAIVVDYLRELNATGTTIILITHDDEVASIADRCVQMRDGFLNDEIDVPPGRYTVRDGKTSDGEPVIKHNKAFVGLIDVVSDALTTITQTITRTALLSLAFALGVCGLIASIGVSQSASVQIADKLNEAALDELTVSQVALPSKDQSSVSWLKETGSIIAGLPGVESTAFRSDIPSDLVQITRVPSHISAQPIKNIPLVVADAALLSVYECSMQPQHTASILSSGISDVAIVGEQAAEAIGVSWKRDSNIIWLSGKPVQVVAVIDSCARDAAILSSVVVSPGTLPFDLESATTIVRTQDGYPAPLAEAIPTALRPDNPAAVRVSTVADLRELTRGIDSDLGSLLGGISGILLLLAVFSGGTSMYLSVRSRRSEIALRRALGASRWAVGRVFLTEGLFLGAAGGLAGSALGLSVILIICVAQQWTPVLSGLWVPLGLSIGGATGVLSAIYPATVAARESPAQAIRGD